MRGTWIGGLGYRMRCYGQCRCGLRTCRVFDVRFSADIRTEKRFGQIDVLVNNAGTNHRRAFHMMKFEDFWRVIEVNFKAVYRAGLVMLNVAYVSDAQGPSKIP